MNQHIYQGLKNNKGSSLTFVIIISMVVMVMVGSLLAVANNGLFFTQESVESRQAYIDAKSVIEFGKIEINDKMAVLKGNVQENKKTNGSETIFYILAPLNEVEDETANGLNGTNLRLINKDEVYDNEGRELIDLLEGLDRVDVLKVLNEIDDLKRRIPVGKGTISWQKTEKEEVSTGITLATTAYTFKIETQNLRRKLDYTVDFNYEIKTTAGTSGGVPERPKMPKDYTKDWKSSQIYLEDGWKSLMMTVSDYPEDFKEQVGVLKVPLPEYDLNITKFDWKGNNKTLDLTAQNIGITTALPNGWVNGAEFNITAANELRIKKNYNQVSGYKTNTLKAKTIIFEKKLEIGSESNLIIECETLFINGDLKLDSSNATLIIKADNIVIAGSITMGKGTIIETDCANIWIDKDIKIGDSQASLKFKEINFLETAKNRKITLDDKSNLAIIGKENQNNNQINIGKLESKSNNHDVSITNLVSFSCEGFELNDHSTLKLESRVVKIDGDLDLYFMDQPIEITTEYLDVTGKTKIERLYGEMNINAMNDTLNLRFEKGYKQTNSKVFINKGDMVVFGKKIEWDYDNINTLMLDISADNIYLDTKTAKIDQQTQFIYSGKLDNSGTNLSISDEIKYKKPGKIIASGKYSNVKGRKLEDLIKPTISYIPPNFPSPPVIPSGSGGEETTEINIENVQTEYD
jgi:hypothetical protein